jgi:hypothetical protein
LVTLRLWFGSIAAVVVISLWIKRWQKDIDDYEEREFRDPPTFDAGSYLSGDRF